MKYKSLIPIIFGLCIKFNLAVGQDSLLFENRYGLEAVSINVEKYLDTIVPSDFSDVFSSKELLQSYKRLRDYKSQKEILIRELSRNQGVYSNSKRDIIELKNFKSTLESYIANFTLENGNYSLNEVDQNNLFNFYQSYYFIPFTIRQRFLSIFLEISPNQLAEVALDSPKYFEISSLVLVEFVKFITDQQTLLENEVKKLDTLTKNIEIAKLDLVLCEVQLDRTLTPEYNRQNFKENISLYFTILIGILLVLFFFIVYKKSGVDLSKELLGGNGLQFVTLFVLIIAIILFGILEILHGSELAAILAGISGYILGKGVKSSATNDNNSGN